ncbi:MAG TPA: hypothetical protein VJT50_11945 [Pyrinomonadaceae bacterium]|nr:hypothetical protein [Pyrinomonadaceae bacterium]
MKAIINNQSLGRVSDGGFTMIQVVVILALISVVTTFGAIGIVNARAHMRLNSSVREFAAWAEKTRGDSVRRHAMGAQRAFITLNDATTYTVSMDFDRNGTMDAAETATHTLDTGVVFTTATPVTITFDWRGRSITGEVTPVMALGTAEGAPSVLITVTGSGDVTLAEEVFQDAFIPAPTLTGNPGGDTRPDPSPNLTATPTPGGVSTPIPSPTATPTPDPNATPTAEPTATPCGNNGANCRTPTPTPTATPTPTPVPTATPTPTPSGTCNMAATPTSLTIGNKVTKSVTLAVSNAGGSTTVSLAGNTNASHISVTLAPGQSATLPSGNGSVRFNILVNGANQSGTLTFTASSPCAVTQTVRVN